MKRIKTASEIADHIRQAKSTCMIIGAGASRAAGIPMASELVATICKDYGHCLRDMSEDDRNNYGKVMAKLSPADRESLITPLLENARISWGQIALATLAQKQHVSRILTFNFDLVLENAAALLGMQLPVYDFAGPHIRYQPHRQPSHHSPAWAKPRVGPVKQRC